MRKTLTTGRIICITLGEFSRAILSGLIVTYLLKFFNVTESSGLPLLLPIGMIGILKGAGIVFDAVTDPIVASWSDKCNSAQGKRIPYMKWSAVPYGLTCLLIFLPPVSTVSVWNIVWVAVMLLCYYMASTLYTVPFLALEQEIVDDPKKRVFFFTIDSLMFVLGSAIIYVLPVLTSVFKANGMSPLHAWQAAIAIFCAVGILCALIPAFSIKESDYIAKRNASYKPILKSFRATFRLRHFRVLVLGYLIMQFGFSFFNTALLYYLDVLLNLSETSATVVLGISIVVSICVYPLVNVLAKKTGKKPLLIFACISYTLIYTGIYFSRSLASAISTAPVTNSLILSLCGENAQVGTVTCAVLIGVLIAFPLACTNIIPPAAFADLAQYDAIETGENKNGMFVATRNFLTKMASAVSTVIISYVMYLGTTNHYPTVHGVEMTALIAAVCLAASVLVYTRYDDSAVVSAIASSQKKAE